MRSSDSGSSNVPYMTRQTGKSLAKLIVIGMMVQLLVIGYVFYQSYVGRSDLVDSQRAGCERGKLDRTDNARGWRTAQKRALSQGQVNYSIHYAHIAAGLEKRSRITCADKFPKAGFLP